MKVQSVYEEVSSNKNSRILNIFVLLSKGQRVSVVELANKYSVNARTIQRDISDIKFFLADYMVDTGECMTIEYDRIEKGYYMMKEIL